MTISSLRRRLAAIEALIKPANSLAWRIDQLNEQQRNQYELWCKRCDDWYERCRADDSVDDIEPDARTYARVLEGDNGPQLRKDIRVALHGPYPLIPITASDDQAAQVYKDYCDAIVLR